MIEKRRKKTNKEERPTKKRRPTKRMTTKEGRK